MGDIVERLRATGKPLDWIAADEIERLRAEIAALKHDLARDIFTQDPDGGMAEGGQRGQ